MDQTRVRYVRSSELEALLSQLGDVALILVISVAVMLLVASAYQ